MKRLNPIFTLFFFLFSLNIALSAGLPNGYVYVSPKSGAIRVAPETSILIRFAGSFSKNKIGMTEYVEVTGTESGTVEGRPRWASDGQTLIFKPANPLIEGERVTVSIDAPVSGLAAYEFHFFVTASKPSPKIQKLFEEIKEDCFEPPDFRPVIPSDKSLRKSYAFPNGVSIPIDMPRVLITINENPDNGYIFLNNWNGQPYNMILDNNGNPIWYLRTPDRRRDFKVQKNGMLTMLVRTGYAFGEGFIGLNQNYEEVATYHAVDGYATDEHGFQVLENGHYLLIGRREERVDMSQYVDGGNKNATVRECAIQEFTPEGEKIFEWRAWDHFDIADSHVPGENDLTGGNIRFPHMNSVDVDDDEHIILSSRHLSEVTKINRQTGEIIWRLGGNKNQFTFINDPLNGQENQHSVRALGDGHYTIFDNGNEHDPPVSRGIEYEVNTENMTATLVWEFRDNPDKYTHWMGNVQRLPNGNTLINWADGSLPKLTEVTPDGGKAFEMGWRDYIHTYRVFRFPWEGKALKPYLIVEPHKENISILCNQFGDPDVAYYNIYGGTSPNPTTVIDTAHTSMKMLTSLENGSQYFFRVTSVNQSGVESGFSNESSAIVNFINPGESMVLNGDFTDRAKNWYFGAYNNANANFAIEEETAHIKIDEAGNESWEIQLVQLQMEIIKGQEYVFEFDAWADSDRTIEAMVLQGMEPYANYGRIGLTLLTRQKQHFAYPFTMNDQTDLAALIVFLFGGDASDVYIDNVVLRRVVDSEVAEPTSEVPLTYELAGNYPNPFNGQTTLCFSVPERSEVSFRIFNVLGKFLFELHNDVYESGSHNVKMDSETLGSGVYVVQMTAKSQISPLHFHDAHKLVLIQ